MTTNRILQNTVLALSLLLGSASFAAPAFACGGSYGRIDPDTSAIEQTVRTYATEHVSAYTANTVHTVNVNGAEATAVLRIQVNDERAYERAIRLTRVQGSTWRVIGVGPRRAIG